MQKIITISDMQDPNDPQGRSYREINAEKKHAFSVGDLVELESGARLFVVKQTRDCDQTPLYSLCADKNDTKQDDIRFANKKWHNGYPEYALKLVVKKI